MILKMDGEPIFPSRWLGRLSEFVPGFLADSLALRGFVGRCTIILHGSTTLGIDDAFSDLDLWVLVSDEASRQAESIAGTRFFSFTLDGKQGHFNLEPADDVVRGVQCCDMERIAELRHCHMVQDADGVGERLIAMAQQPMRESVRRAWFCHHYVEMRAFHRNCDNPIERGDALAVLQGLVPALNHALRAAMVLDREPYPYIKWLGRAASRTPTGRRLSPLVQHILDLLGTNTLRHPGPERTHPLGAPLREIRQILVESARRDGIDEPWLDRWWEHLAQATEGVRSVVW